jgi:plastocyanin
MKKKQREGEWSRRDVLECMAWVGTGAVWALARGGGLRATSLDQMAGAGGHVMQSGAGGSGLRFVQISDSHIGFNKEANPDVTSTLRLAVAKIKAAPERPSFVLHTGDLTHLSRPEEFDILQQALTELSVPVFYVPGEHDMLNDEGKSYLARFGRDTQGDGWYSFDQGGVHFIGLVNVLNLKAGGLGSLGEAQLAWLEKDVQRLSRSTPIVVFAHIPLWSVYPEWGWGTEDSGRALALLKRFGSVSVLNGHIHQVMQKVEGDVCFHTAMSTAFPQPAPGTAKSPGPMTVAADRLKQILGITRLSFHDVNHPIAITDVPLENGSASAAAGGAAATEAGAGATEVAVDNFRFTPGETRIPIGATVTWINHDDVPHSIYSTDRTLKSPALDTDERFSHRFDTAGSFEYYCSLHPKMTGRITVG